MVSFRSAVFVIALFLLFAPVQATEVGVPHPPLAFKGGKGIPDSRVLRESLSPESKVNPAQMEAFSKLFWDKKNSQSEKIVMFEKELKGKWIEFTGKISYINIYPQFNVLVSGKEGIQLYTATFSLAGNDNPDLISREGGTDISLLGQIADFSWKDTMSVENTVTIHLDHVIENRE